MAGLTPELRRLKGAQVLVRMRPSKTVPPDLTVRCQVMQIDNSTGKLRVLVKPVHGNGMMWLSIARLERFPDGQYYRLPQHPDFK